MQKNVFAAAFSSATIMIDTKRIFVKEIQCKLYSKVIYLVATLLGFLPLYMVYAAFYSLIYFYGLDLNNESVE